jgi:phage I-like protein
MPTPSTDHEADLRYVRTMADAATVDDEGVSDWFTVLKTGEFYHGTDTLKITEQDLDKAVANFEAFKAAEVEVPIDYDHSFAVSGNSRAAGWYFAMKRDGSNLLARVKWTKTAAEAIKNGEYKYFSSEYHETYSSPDIPGVKGFTMLSGGLTNRPALKAMGAVALSEKAAEEVKETAITLGELAGFDMTAEPRPEQRSRMPEEKDKKVDVPEMVSVKLSEELSIEVPKASEDAIKALAEKAAKAPDEKETKTLSEKEAQIKTLSETVVEQGKQLTDERFTRRFDEFQRKGHVDAKPETRETWRGRVDKFGFDETMALLAELPVHIPVEERGSSTEAGDPAAKGDGEINFETPEGRVAFNAEVEKRMAKAKEDGKTVTLAEVGAEIEREVREKVAA